MNTSLSHTFCGVSRADEPAGRSPVRPPSPVCGLSASEVERSRALYGSNVLSPGKRPGFMRRFLGNLNDPIVKKALQGAREHCLTWRVLGNYHKL